MSNEPINRTRAGVPAGGEFAVTPRAQADVALVAPPISAADALNQAWPRKGDSETVVANAATSLIATAVLRAYPTAAYLDLDEENTKYGQVRSGAVRAADGTVLLAHLDDHEGDGRTLTNGDVESLAEDVDGSLVLLSSLAMAESSPAVNDPRLAAGGWMGQDGLHRINLKLAAALYPNGPEEQEYDQTFKPCSVCFERNMDTYACPNIKTECLDCCPCDDH